MQGGAFNDDHGTHPAPAREDHACASRVPGGSALLWARQLYDLCRPAKARAGTAKAGLAVRIR